MIVENRLRPRAVPPKEAAAYLGIGLTKTYELIAAGSLRAVKLGKRTLVDVRSMDDLLDNAPAAEINRAA